MNPGEFALGWHYQRFLVECLRRSGSEFQSFFEQIMEKADPSFIKVKASGREGDWKNDGFSQKTGTVYQVYAPERLTAAEAVAKIEEDCEGARDHWASKMRGWVFVWSSEKALPPQVVDKLAELRNRHPDLSIDDWGHEGLWAIVEALSDRDRVELLGPVPYVDVAPGPLVTATTAAEVRTLLNYLAEQEVPLLDEDLDLTALSEKLDRNRFGEPIRAVVNAGFPLVSTVRHYVTNHPDPRFSHRVAVALADAYDELRDSLGDTPDAIFVGIVETLAAGHTPETREYWAAVGIVDHYFELCDIFER